MPKYRAVVHRRVVYEMTLEALNSWQAAETLERLVEEGRAPEPVEENTHTLYANEVRNSWEEYKNE